MWWLAVTIRNTEKQLLVKLILSTAKQFTTKLVGAWSLRLAYEQSAVHLNSSNLKSTINCVIERLRYPKVNREAWREQRLI